MERRYQVFISSTYTDLREERRAAMQAVLEMDCFPAGMELFPAADDTAWEYIRRVIQESDYYVVVIGARYGSRDDSGLGFTEREYDYAVELGKPTLAFLHGEPAEIPIGKADLSEQDRVALEAFRQKVRRKLCDHWTTSLDLRAKVLSSLNRLKKSHPSGGWVRAGEVPAAQLELDLERARRELAEARIEVQQLNEAASQPRGKLPPAKSWGHETTLTVEIATDTKSRDTQVTTTWDQIFLAVGPRLAERPLSTASVRTLVARHASGLVTVPKGAKLVVGLKQGDKVAFHLRGIGVIESHNGYWRLTDEGWAELDALLVEVEEAPGEVVHDQSEPASGR